MAKLKICKNCGEKVNVASNFCPQCKSESFNEISTLENIKYILFYWQVDGGYVLSKTKVITLLIYISCVIDWFICGSYAILGDTLTAVALLAVGFALHKILKNDKPSENVVKNTDTGLINDLIHLFFYWQDKETGLYDISMTKIIALIASIMLGLYYDITIGNTSIMRTFGASLVVAVPTFTVGYIIHRFS